MDKFLRDLFSIMPGHVVLQTCKKKRSVREKTTIFNCLWFIALVTA
jgi:hypothetical protein